jgi:phosphatidylglycerophosphate synthase
MVGPATQVTLARAALAVGVALLALAHATAPLVALAGVALALDAVDGWLARRTDTVTAFGARLDGEVDAFLILVLSIYVAGALGAWVLAIGAARYVFLAGEALVPWMRAPLPPRRWRKVVAAAQGIVLTVAAAGVVPRTPMQILLAVALAALVVSMAECTWWLWRRRARDTATLTALALLVVWAALVAPNHPRHLTLSTLAQLPLELLVVIGIAALLPAAPRRVLAGGLGALVGLLVVVKVLDLGMYTAFDRQFDPVYDWGYAGIGVETLRDAIGTSRADLAVIVVLLAAVALLVLPVLALLRVARAAAGHRPRALSAAAALGLVWVVLRAFGVPVASTTESAFAVREVRAVQAGLRDHDVLARAIARDRYAGTPHLLQGLRGKDVLLLFVESYGRVAVQSPAVDAVLDRGTAALRSAGFSARSAFLRSPTFGGISWLAHSTLQTGLWIDSRRRYDQLVKSRRFTLSQAFERAGWRAVGLMPQDKRAWKEGSTFYHYDRVYDRRNVGYRGPAFALPAMPDQYVLAALQRLELDHRRRPPLFAEVDLISSHAPWTRIPQLIPWGELGDGSVFDRLPARTPPDARAGYAQSIEYTLRAVASFVRRYGDDKLVVIAVGDHQPATVVTGQGASHDVPISVIAHDPQVLRRIAGWGWGDGLRPQADAPVWPMSAFRDRFLSAFGR